MMHSVVSKLDDRLHYQPARSNSVHRDVARALAAFEAHLNRTGKVCLKPWCWRRFYLLYKPGFEPPWLSSWWAMSPGEKKSIFLKQMEYLAYHTDQFDAAYQFLLGLNENNWVIGTGSSAQ